MSQSDYVTSIDVAEVQTEEGDYHNVSTEIYRNWVKVEDESVSRWIPRDIVVEIFERKHD